MKQQQKSLHRVESFDTLATSFVTSACSAPSMRTDYGLARAMNSSVVPNDSNPIATIKDRKNANYMEDLGDQHDLLRTELDEAIVAFEDITLARDTNKNVLLEAMLDRKFLEANNALARCSREYSCFLNDTKELKEMPKMSREELARRFTTRKEQEKANREDENAPSMKQRMRHIEDQIVDLELEKEYLTERLGQSAALAERSAQMEHLIENLERERLVILKQFASSERLRGQHENDVDQLYEDLAYQQHLNRQTQRDNAKITVDLETTTRANEMMKHDLESQREKAIELSEQLQNTQNDIRNHQRQLSFTKTTATTLRDDNKKLRQEINELNEMCSLARDELEDLHDQNVQMSLERQNMQESREMQKETNAYLRNEFGEMHGLAVNEIKKAKAYRTEKANIYGYAEKLKAELAAMKARAMRRDSVVGRSTEGEAQRSASA
ncbi:hypothetical protein CKM354_000409000 [Cercospora kikuchii]|uniref:Uncharacterized protein n=1 Tax=Cercospora kikuchii TaxID=84275 RepID=A0A9P3CDG1_9PEZI|nr:uncharacterized protein CKM354_000409000 [Cercospora kikuchii]GIZ40763.1 hypothetical protein CKM354_000409000 [Cercospora kikuchii]